MHCIGQEVNHSPGTSQSGIRDRGDAGRGTLHGGPCPGKVAETSLRAANFRTGVPPRPAGAELAAGGAIGGPAPRHNDSLPRFVVAPRGPGPGTASRGHRGLAQVIIKRQHLGDYIGQDSLGSNSFKLLCCVIQTSPLHQM